MCTQAPAPAPSAAAPVEVVATAGGAGEAERLCAALSPDAVVVEDDDPTLVERLSQAAPAAAVVGGTLGGEATVGLAAALSGRDATAALLAADRAATARRLHDETAQLLTAAALRLQAAVEFDELTPALALEVAGELQAAARATRSVLALLAGDRVPAGVAATVLAERVRRSAPEAVVEVELDDTAAEDVAVLAVVLAPAAAAAGPGARVRVARAGARLQARVQGAPGGPALTLDLPAG